MEGIQFGGAVDFDMGHVFGGGCDTEPLEVRISFARHDESRVYAVDKKVRTKQYTRKGK